MVRILSSTFISTFFMVIPPGEYEFLITITHGHGSIEDLSLAGVSSSKTFFIFLIWIKRYADILEVTM